MRGRARGFANNARARLGARRFDNAFNRDLARISGVRRAGGAGRARSSGT